jgi:type IV pilus assembly protein PilY1
MTSPARARKPKTAAAATCLLLGAALLASGPLPLSAATTDLADVPLASATTIEILPNIGFIYDDSGSMDDENMPDDDGTNKDKFCWKWFGYNTLAYNPAVTYLPPKKADGTRFPDASFTAAPRDGFFAIGQKMYNGSTTNTAVDLSAISSIGVLQSDAALPSFSRSHRVTSVKVTLLDGTTIELLNTTPVPASGTTDRDTIGAAVAASINAKTGTTGFTATYDASSNILTIRAPESQAGLTSTPVITTQKTQSGGSLQGITASAFSTVYTNFFYSTHKTNPASTTCEVNANYTVVGNKADIAAPGATKGSAQAQTNYANWYSYYRKRAFMAKTAAGEAFAALGQDKFRVGLFFIASIEGESDQAKTNNDLRIDKFSGSTAGTHRANWFDRLYNSRQALYTPLRGALSRMGRMYAGKVAGWDPVQYSCQRNFAILTTDGFWNTQAESTTYGPLREDNVSFVNDQDGGATRPSYDSSKATNTLADVAYYYYHTDLRGDMDNNVPPAGTNPNTDDVATHQHMTTFTIGLGVNGVLKYQDGYKTSTSGDYFDIKQGTKNWPNPTTDQTKIDDLWHAAVNGRGTYFSAKNSESFVQGITSALGSIESTTGSGAAAATSNLQPTAGDNFIYIANYRTVLWDGELSAYTVDLASGAISSTPLWLASPLLDAKVAASGDSDTRTIYTSTSTALKEFRWANLTGAEQALFDPTKLTQAIDWTPDEKTAATGESLLNYLRGHHRLENQDRPVDFGAYNRLYRDREKVLGDIVHSQPVFVKRSFYTFADAGYTTFTETVTKTRAGAVYVASNEGMLHAFDESGQERWAYVPPILMKEMYRLADRNYPTNHRYFIDGPLAVSDVQVGGSWKTILVGALGKGGRGLFALDITSPSAPKFLWTFTADDEPNLGYTYGTPMITKHNGKWVVLVASGYNNVPEGGQYGAADGRGYVWALDAGTGKIVFTWKTEEGNVGNPSGLARINLYVPNFEKDNTMEAAYGGDLYGNMWRFDPDGTVHKIVALGSSQAITAPPEIGEVDGKTILYFGTGRYLGEDDLKTTNVQAIYGVWDDGKNTSTVTKSQLVEQTISGTSITSNPVDWGTQYGWYVNMAKTGERVSLGAQLYFGTLIVASVIPSATECQPGGSGRLYFLDYRTGGPVGGGTGGGGGGSGSPIYDYVAPIVGITVSRLPGGTPKVYAITSSGGVPPGEPPDLPIPPGGAGSELSGQRIMWRELIN